MTAAQVQVDLASGRVAVESAQPADTLKAAIDEAGYTVTGVANGNGTPAAQPAKRVHVMFKVAVIGASGLLGRALVDELAQQTDWQVVATAFSRPAPNTVALDIRDAQAVEQFVEREAPDALVIAAAERRPDVCEHDPALARALNVDAVRTLAAAATGAAHGRCRSPPITCSTAPTRPTSTIPRPRRSMPMGTASSKASAR